MANDNFTLEDAAYQMSMPSDDPADVLGYTQKHSLALKHGLSRQGWNPYYDVYMPTRRDYYNKGSKTSYWGATPQAGSTWTMAGSDGPGEMMNSYLSDLARSNVPEDRIDARNWRSSDQTVYLNNAIRSQKRHSTVIHESVHRGIGKVYPEVFGDVASTNMNELLTRIWDYRHQDYDFGDVKGEELKKKQKKMRAMTERYIRTHATLEEGLDPKKELVTLEYALDKHGPTLDRISAAANVKYHDDDDLDLVWFDRTGKGKLDAK